uniref:NADH-ubiquinone oxidoreductase chain 4 n=1 Tax=Thetys vagina TaxID=942565 RepID=A0AA86IJW2_9UROC|nr:NADH dehydrogenase subunit 4 [Thetys vagina]
MKMILLSLYTLGVTMKLLTTLGISYGLNDMSVFGPMGGLLLVMGALFGFLLYPSLVDCKQAVPFLWLYIWHLIAFICEDLLSLIICSDIMIMIIALGFGFTSYNPGDLISSWYFTYYLLIPSAPLLTYAFFSYSDGITNKYVISFCKHTNSFYYPSALGFLLLLSGLAKLPFMGLHYWLPKAHVQAPTPLSMILAGLSLKLGLILVLFVVSNFHMNTYLMKLLLLIIFTSLIVTTVSAITATDSKVFLAYCSVAHMTLAGGAVFMLLSGSLWGGWLVALGHCISSPLLFQTAGLIQGGSGTRILKKLKYFGFGIVPLTLLIYLLFDMPFPPAFSFWGELYIFGSMFWCFGFFGSFLLLVPFVMLVRAYEVYYNLWYYTGNKNGTTYIFMLGSLLGLGFLII